MNSTMVERFVDVGTVTLGVGRATALARFYSCVLDWVECPAAVTRGRIMLARAQDVYARAWATHSSMVGRVR